MTGRNNDTSVLIKSYVPYSILVRFAVISGNVISPTNFGKNFPIAKTNVFLIKLSSLLILSSNYFTNNLF